MQDVRARLRPAFLQLLRWRYVLLCGGLVFRVTRQPFEGLDWAWFDYGTNLLFGVEPDPSVRQDPRKSSFYRGEGGLHTFATEPRLHMGPLSLLVAAAIKLAVPGNGRLAAMILMTALGPLIVFLAERAAVQARRLGKALDEPMLPVVTLLSGGAFLFFWAEVAWAWAHLDEVFVICCAALALRFVLQGRAVPAGAAVGLSIAAKSWGVLLIPLLAGLPRRQAVKAAAVGLLIGVATWLPFVIADAGTIDAGRAAVGVHPASGAHALGVDLGRSPDWLRPVQVAVALSLATLAVARGRWLAAILLAIAARLALDPAAFGYYTAALAFAALIWDLFGTRVPLPIWGLAIFIAFHGLPRLVDDPQLEGFARIGVAIAASAVVLVLPRAWVRHQRAAG